MKQKAEKKDLNYFMNLRYKVEIVPLAEEGGGGYEARIPQLGGKLSVAMVTPLKRLWPTLNL
jgi:hypothetical protein